MVQGVAQACTQNPLLASKDEAIRMMGQWGSTPDVCACQGKMLRSVLTPDVLALKGDDQREFFLKFALTKNAECLVPAFKVQFSATCENFFAVAFKSMPLEKVSATLQSRGYADLDAYLASTCSCLRPAVQKISTKDWVDGSVAAYNAYLERKRTGNQSLPTPKSAFDQVIEKCAVPLAGKDAKASDAAPAMQAVEATGPTNK